MGSRSRRLQMAALVFALAVAGGIGAAPASATFTQCPQVDQDTGCQFLITVTDNGVQVAEDNTLGPYDGSDDTLVGIQNSSSKTISSIPVSAEEEIFAFDGDGICEPTEEPRPSGCVVLPKNAFGEATLNAGKPCPPEFEACAFPPPSGEPANLDPFSALGIEFVGIGENGQTVSGYEGPTSWFTSISSDFKSGVVNFSPALAPGASTYFSLEEALTGKSITIGNSTTLSTNLSGGGQNGGSITVPQGTSVTDTATVGGSTASSATGSVSYTVYSDSACTAVATQAGSGSVSGGTAAASSAVSTLAPGKYYWRATYSGDITNQGSSSSCGSEVLTVVAPPPPPPAPTSVSTSQSGGGMGGASITVPAGTPVTDKATVSGAKAASSTGTVSYVLYKDSKCTVPALAGGTAPESKGTAGPSAAVKAPVGTYYWGATYSGDPANAGSTSACGSEVLTVAKVASLGLPSPKMCVSKRRFIAHPRAPKGVKLVHVEVLINGKRKFTGGLVKRHTTIDLRGLPKGTFRVAMIAKSSTGQTYEDVRTYHTCVPKKRHKKK